LDESCTVIFWQRPSKRKKKQYLGRRGWVGQVCRYYVCREVGPSNRKILKGGRGVPSLQEGVPSINWRTINDGMHEEAANLASSLQKLPRFKASLMNCEHWRSLRNGVRWSRERKKNKENGVSRGRRSNKIAFELRTWTGKEKKGLVTDRQT